jgi:hypothetical protein
MQKFGIVGTVLLQGHSWSFDGLQLKQEDYPEGSTLEIRYRIDAEEMTPLLGSVSSEVPSFESMIHAKYGEDMTSD